MTLAQVSRTILMESVPSTVDPYLVPFGRTGCCLLPDGTYLVSVVIEDTATNYLHVWKIADDGTVLGEVNIDAETDTVGRAHLIALDGFMVQALFLTSSSPGGKSYILDASGDDPVVTDTFTDDSIASGYSGTVNSMYLRGPGVVFVIHALGVTTYKRGRPIVTRRAGFGGGESLGPYPHPTDPYKVGWWGADGDAPTKYYQAYEATIREDGIPTITMLSPVTMDADYWWIVGAGSPYAASPLILQSNADNTFALNTVADPTTEVWTDDIVTYVNADNGSFGVGTGTDRFVFWCEEERQNGVYPTPTGPGYGIRVMVVDANGGTPTIERVDLDYGTTSPAGYPDDEYDVSLFTGSHCVDHRNGEIVVSTCVVQQESSPDYYSVISWKLTGGDLVEMSGLDGTPWSIGIDNGDGRLNLQSTDGWLPEATQDHGIDAPAQPVYVKTSDGWRVLGRFVDTALPDLPDPAPPTFVDVTFTADDINTDLVAAQALAGATFGPESGHTWGAFVAQSSPPSAGNLSDGSDATGTVLAQAAGTSDPVEVFTARMVPDVALPVGGVPYQAAWKIRGKAGASSDAVSYLDGMITVPTTQANIRGRGLLTAFNLGPALSTNHYGASQRFNTPDAFGPPRFEQAYTQGQTLEQALGASYDSSAQWWHDFLDDPAAYVVVQSAATNPAHGAFELVELSFTIRYLIP